MDELVGVLCSTTPEADTATFLHITQHVSEKKSVFRGLFCPPPQRAQHLLVERRRSRQSVRTRLAAACADNLPLQCLETMRASVQSRPASEESLPFGSLCLVRPSQEVVPRVVLHPLSLQLFLFHSSVLEPDFHLASFAMKRGKRGWRVGGGGKRGSHHYGTFAFFVFTFPIKKKMSSCNG